MQDFRIDLGRKRRVLGRFQDRRTPGGERRKDLERDLVDRPVPRRDQARGSDRFAQKRVAVGKGPTFLLRLKRLDEAVGMADARLGLHLARHGDRRAHLEAHRLREVFMPGRGALADAFEEREAVGFRPSPELFERLVAAAWTARSTSGRLPSATVPTCSSMDGSMIGIVAVPSGATHPRRCRNDQRSWPPRTIS
jgi:hypothetical protein